MEMQFSLFDEIVRGPGVDRRNEGEGSRQSREKDRRNGSSNGGSRKQMDY